LAWGGKQSVNQASVNQQDISKVEIRYPKSLPEQQRIVGILDKAFEGLATAKANAKKNLKSARAIFESELNAIFQRKGDDWRVRTIGDVCTLRSGTTVTATLEKKRGDYPYLKVADMSHADNEKNVVASSRYLDKVDIRQHALLPAGTTIFPKRGGAILTNKKKLTGVPICADLNIMGVIPGESLIPKFLYFYFINIDMRRLGSGSSIPQINNYDISPLSISFPERDGQQRIVARLECCREETQRLESIYQRKLEKLDALKKSLLHHAFTGQL
jgi:type I restriction enzyme, S subunit